MATRKPAVPVDEKFTDQDFDLFLALKEFDAKNYNWFSTLTEEQKKKFVPYTFIHWASSIDQNGPLAAYYVLSVNERANKHWIDDSIKNHPELQWLMLCAASPKLGKQYHKWIPHLRDNITQMKERASRKDIKDYFSKVYKTADEVEERTTSYVKEQQHSYDLAKLYPNMKLEDIKQLSKLVTIEDIAQYEKDSGN